MFWSDLAFRRILQIFGTIQIVRFIWVLRRKYKPTARGRRLRNTCLPNENERLLEELNMLKEDFLRVKAGLEVLLTNQQEAEKIKEDNLHEHLRTREELFEKIEENTKTLRAGVELTCTSNFSKLNALLEASMLKHEQDKAEHMKVAELTRTEMKQLRETVKIYQAEMKQFLEDSAKSARMRFEKMQTSLQEKFDAFMAETVRMYEKAYEDNRTSEAKSRKEVLTETIERYKKVTAALGQLENTQMDCLSKFEICITGKMDKDLLPLGYQSESFPLRGNILENITILWRISGFQKKLNSLREESIVITSKEFFLIQEGLKVKPVLTRSRSTDAFVGIHLEFMEERNEDSEAGSPFLHYRRFTLLDQRAYSTDSTYDNIELIDRPPFKKDGNMKDEYFFNRDFFRLEEFHGEGKYVKQDHVLIKITLEPLVLITRHLASSSGVLVWKIERYSKEILAQVTGRKGWLISKPFRTSDLGYHAQVEVMLCSDEDDANNANAAMVSVRVRFILGASDRMLKLPIRGLCRHILMNQSKTANKNDIDMIMEFGYDDVEENHSKGQRSEAGMVQLWTMPKCFPRCKADSPPFMRDDSIVIKTELTVH